MSEFDKEAEREKLREKYERDQEKRRSTQVMSDLLLKGATMTNRHCDACGDPIFRYDGQEFCPTCQREANGTEQTESADEAGDETGQTAADETESAVASAKGQHPGQKAETSASPAGSSQRSTRSPEAVDRTPAANRGRTAGSDREDVSLSTPGPDDGLGADGDGLETAQQSLVDTIVKFTRMAESTDDPRRAKEALSAAREAAETLRVLPR